MNDTPKFESPIEALLAKAITEEIARCRMQCRPIVQAKIGPYRVDILLELDGRKLVIECDGKEFHAANNEQIERDKRRDRFFAARNIVVMRFTGSEINRSPRACAAEVGSWLESSPSDRKAAIMDDWERGKISRLSACRLIRRGRLVDA